MRPRHAVVLTFPIADSRPSWSYLQAGTLPRLISFVCHSCENCRVCTQNSHSETLSPEFANLPSTKLHGGVGRFFRSVHSAFTYPFFRWPELANRPGRLSHAPLQVSIEENPGPAETVDCQPPLHRFPRVTGHRSRVSPNVSNVFPIYPLCFHALVALIDSTALEQLFSNQPVTHSFRRDGGCTPSRTLPIFSASLSTVPSHEPPVTSHESPVTSHQSRDL